MSVIGIDFGNDSCYVAVARQGGIETLANEYSMRSTPTCVAFGEKLRLLGYSAKQQHASNIKNTVVNFKKILGKTFKESSAQAELKSLPYKVAEQKDGSIGIVVQYLSETKTFSPTQVTAMMLTKLKNTAEVALKIKVVDVVIGVPCFLDDGTRHAMMEAGATAGLNILRLMNETTATALAYGIYKQDLPAEEEKPRNVVFVDCGQSNMQVAAVAFNKGKLKVLSQGYDSRVGGREFDRLIGKTLSAEFLKKTKISLANYPKSWIRLLSECEKVKKQMSANSTALPLNIECLADDMDFSSKMKREDLEELSTEILERATITLQTCLTDSNLKVEDIYSVEIVGGASRMPALKQLIEKVYKKTPSTTLNADEAVARGCALQCAILSPTFKVREFSITDVQPYAINLAWKDDSGQNSGMEVFSKNHGVPFSKMLTFYRKEPFTIQAHYSSPSPSANSTIGQFTIQDVTPTVENESQKVKIKVRVNVHGLFTVASATMSEKRETVEEESTPTPMETDQTENGTDQQNGAPSTDAQDKTAEEKTGDSAEAAQQLNPTLEKKSKKFKTVDLGVYSLVNQLNTDQLNSIIEEECQMIQNDKLETERMNSRNFVEEYLYEVREKIDGALQKFISEDDRTKLSKLLSETEEWLYEDGEDCAKQVYVDKLSVLKTFGDPVMLRKREREEVPVVFERLLGSLQIARKVVTSFHTKGDDTFAHLDAAEIQKVEQALVEKEKWCDKQMGAISVCPLDKDLPITSQKIQAEKTLFEGFVNPIINKPKPAPKVEEKPAPPTTEEKPPQEPTKPETQADQMDVD